MTKIPELYQSQDALTGWKRWLLIGTACAFAISGMLFAMAIGGFYFWLKPGHEVARSYDLTQLDRIDSPASRVRLEQVSNHFINALIAAEDPRFYQHHGVDFRAMADAMIWRKKAGHGATITEKLVKLTYGDQLSNPAVELCLALRIERLLHKEQILELYVNRLYFGDDYHGIAAASEGYFGKPPKALNLAESATLAGVIRNPLNQSPRRNPEVCKQTRDYVLNLMKKQGFLDEPTTLLAVETPVIVISETSRFR